MRKCRKCPIISPDEGKGVGGWRGGGGVETSHLSEGALKWIFLAAPINPSEIGIKLKLKVCSF